MHVLVAIIIVVLMAIPAIADDQFIFRQVFGAAAPSPISIVTATPDKRVFDEVFGYDRSTLIPATNTVAFEEQPAPPQWVYPIIMADLRRMPDGQRTLTRYLDLSKVFPREREGLYGVLSCSLNSLSWNNRITRPEYVPGTNNRLVRFNIAWYCRDLVDIQRWMKAWDKMTSFDEYYLEPWVSRQNANDAFQLTGSVGPVLRADFFCFYAMQEDDKNTKAVEGFYSDFLGLPGTEKELLGILKVRLDEIAELGADRKGLVVKSGTASNAVPVAFNNRMVNRAPTVLVPHGGYFYYTQDFVNSRGNRNVLRDPLNSSKDGGEYIFSLPNYLQGYYLTARQVSTAKNGKKIVEFKQVSEVPIEIASSTFSHRRVKINTCANCHSRGINSYRDVFEETLLKIGSPGGIVLLTEQKPDTVLRARQLFSSDIKGYVNADQLNYTIALENATGMTPESFARTWKFVSETYEAPLTPRRAAWEFGTNNITDYLADKVVSTTNGSLLLLIKANADDHIIQRDTFEEEFRNGMLLQEIKANVRGKSGVRARVVVPATVSGILKESVPTSSSSKWWIRNYPSARQESSKVYYPAKDKQPMSHATLLRCIKERRIDPQTELWQANVSKQWLPAQALLPNEFRR